MTSFVEIQNEHAYPISPDLLVRAAQAVIVQQAASPLSALTIVLEQDAAVAALNRRYRQVDAPTDVLSFPAELPPLPPDSVWAGVDIEADMASAYLGDLVIAFPYACAQAAREGHDLHDSLMLLVVHGVLHLLGHDHDTAENRARMWAAQEAALHLLGISPELVPALEGADH